MARLPVTGYYRKKDSTLVHGHAGTVQKKDT